MEKLPDFDMDYTELFDSGGHGLISAMVLHRLTLKPLMQAFMNEKAFNLSRQTGEAHFFSRERDGLWLKGETSGNKLLIAGWQKGRAGTLLVYADPLGPTCHRGYESCFDGDFELIEPVGPTNQYSLPYFRLNYAKLFDSEGHGLIPTFVVDAASRNPLVQGFMTEGAYGRSWHIGEVFFFSREAQALYPPLEKPLAIQGWQVDCDADSLLIYVTLESV